MANTQRSGQSHASCRAEAAPERGRRTQRPGHTRAAGAFPPFLFSFFFLGSGILRSATELLSLLTVRKQAAVVWTLIETDFITFMVKLSELLAASFTLCCLRKEGPGFCNFFLSKTC